MNLDAIYKLAVAERELRDAMRTDPAAVPAALERWAIVYDYMRESDEFDRRWTLIKDRSLPSPGRA